MNFKYKAKDDEVADIDVTSFMNLMIVLVPVLLLSMTFTQTTVLEIKLPELTGGGVASDDPQSKLEVELTADSVKVYYPENTLVQDIPKIQTEEGMDYDYRQLSLVLQAVKAKVPEKQDILLRSELDIDYQHIVGAMDTLKSYKTVVAASVVEIELFPEISLDDARKVVKARSL
ncbi:ExbD/TolR family protein [Agarilytica rhodophyticola]|uniref:ExbD/TolR family protein n=1 Tax=Agarilytica rhodophyticola TaxID=1737490 RepID=UPI000B348FCB|nr:biopolymer transporter ExbD [Agarilytica rhodophyticola]